MKEKKEFTVRLAEAADTDRIMALERASYFANGMHCYGRDHVEAWLEVYPDGLYVAEWEGEVVGYTCTQLVDFDVHAPHVFKSHDLTTDGGYIRKTHQVGGNSVYGLSICSNVAGAARAMFDHICRTAKEQGRDYYLGSARIPGFDNFIHSLNHSEDLIDLDELALWYVHECIEMVDGLTLPSFPAKPNFSLPHLGRPDPVLCKYLKAPNHYVVSVLPDYMQDSESRNFGVLMVFLLKSF